MRFAALAVFLAMGLGCSADKAGPPGSGGQSGQGGEGGEGGDAGQGGGSGGRAGSGGQGGRGGQGGQGGATPDAAAPDTATSPDASVDGVSAAEAGGGADSAPPDLGPPGPLTLTSSAFAMNGVIVRKYRCQGEGMGGNVSPPLTWTRGPVGTLSYAVTMRSGGSPHWALWDIPADTLSLPEKIERLAMPPIPPGSKQCKPNVDGSTWFGYAGACPMGGTNLRPYYFVVWALKVATLPNVTPQSTIAQVNAAIMANQIGMATLIGMAAPNSP